VKGVPAPGAAHPLRVDRWGSRFCMLIPMCPEQANSDLLYDAGATHATFVPHPDFEPGCIIPRPGSFGNTDISGTIGCYGERRGQRER
jgi:hypothetical protein